MPYSTGCLNRFDLVALNDSEIVLLFPTPRSQDEVPSYVHYEKLLSVLKTKKNGYIGVISHMFIKLIK